MQESKPESKQNLKQESKQFDQLGLNQNLLDSLFQLGYETPTQIQEHSIPILLQGHDLLAQAQTGTGKTAAFALPCISNLDFNLKKTQIVVIAPTRELAIQVAEAFKSYSKHIKNLNVTSIYGGQDYNTQLKALKRGSQVIVGTPGRLIDHIKRGSLSLESLKTIVLDEADEMLKMGFSDDIQWIFDQIKQDHQTALFSATMPNEIKKIAQKYLSNAKEVKIKSKTVSVETIEQYYLSVSRNQKLDILTRFLDSEEIDASIIFSRTKNYSNELAEKLQARGYAAAALNGDMNQSLREKTIAKLKSGAIDIIVATDVAARGIDVPRVSHVINIDIPHDSESYIHRIGRTGRAGKQGKAISFISPREFNLLRNIERTINAKIPKIDPPSIKEINEKRDKKLAEQVIDVINQKASKLSHYHNIIDRITSAGEYNIKDIAAAFAYLMQPAQKTIQTDFISQDEQYQDKSFKNKKRDYKSRDRKSNNSYSSGYSNNSRSRNSDYKSGSRPGSGYKSGYKSESGSGYKSKSPDKYKSRNKDGDRDRDRDTNNFKSKPTSKPQSKSKSKKKSNADSNSHNTAWA